MNVTMFSTSTNTKRLSVPKTVLATVRIIPLSDLAIALIPVAIVVLILFRWSLGGKFAIYALARMLLQLLAIGYVLTYIFEAKQPWIVLVTLATMRVGLPCVR